MAMPTTRARGEAVTAGGGPEASSRAQAPSLTPEALPAVTESSGPLTPFQQARSARWFRGRGARRADHLGSPFFCAMTTGTSSSCRSGRRRRRRPALLRAQGAKASWSARPMAKSAATLSAVWGIEWVSYSFFISGLTKRQPMVVSKIAALRA